MPHMRRALLTVVLCLCAVPAGAQSIASLFTTLPADFGHLFTPTNAIVIGAGGAGSLALHPKDREIARRIQADTGTRADVFGAGATLGDGVEQGAFALGMYVAGRVLHS